MKHIITVLLLFNFCQLFAQQQDEIKFIHRFSIELEGGLINSMLNTPWVCTFCDCIDCESYEPQKGKPARPIVAPMALAYLNFQVSERHQVGLGYSLSQYGEMDWPSDYSKRAITYQGLNARHTWILLKGDKTSLGISNSLCFEFPKPTDFFVLAQKGLSHTATLKFQREINPRLALSFNLLGRTALTEYAKKAWYGMNNRWGFGASLGFQVKI
ncbi:MAG: hypothetical protein IT258_14435 [Saprospiraceae bacterium]|nr:hypothetical protein [Saprospiraceae bacterium]